MAEYVDGFAGVGGFANGEVGEVFGIYSNEGDVGGFVGGEDFDDRVGFLIGGHDGKGGGVFVGDDVVVGDDQAVGADDEPGGGVGVELVTVPAEPEAGEDDGGFSCGGVEVGLFGGQGFGRGESDGCGFARELGLELGVVLGDFFAGDTVSVCVESGLVLGVVDDEVLGLEDGEGCDCGEHWLSDVTTWGNVLVRVVSIHKLRQPGGGALAIWFGFNFAPRTSGLLVR